MGKILRKGLALTLVFLMVFSSIAFAFAAETPDAEKEDSLLMTIEELRGFKYPAPPAQKPAVMLNGEYVAFNDAVPVNVNGRIMVPFRAILEAMGATVDYNSKTKEIRAILDDKEISFYAGKADIKVVEDGKESTVKMDVVPFIDAYTQRMFVSTRFVAEAFGLSVGWDSIRKTVVIIDYDKMVPEIAEKFEIIGLLFDTQDYDFNNSYETTGSMNMDITVAKSLMQELSGVPTEKNVTASFDMNIAGIQKALNLDMAIDMEADIDDLYPIIGITEESDKAAIEAIIKNLDVKLKMDDENIYISMPALDYLLNGEVPGAAVTGTTWYEIPLQFVYDVYAEMGMDYEAMLNSAATSTSVNDIIELILSLTEGYMTVETYYDVCGVVAALNELIGDDQFRKSGNTYTLSLNEKSFALKLAKFVDIEDVNAFIAEFKDSGVTFDVNLSIKTTSAGKLSSYTMKTACDIDLTGQGEGFDKASVKLDASGSLYKSDVTFVFDLSNLCKVTVTAKENVKETTKTPDVKIPTGDTVIDISTLMQ